MEPKIVRSGLIMLIMYDKLQAPAFTEKLRGYGYDDVVVCSDGKAALEKLKKNEPSVVISDVELKGEFNGIETGQEIRKNWNIPLIFLSRLQDERTFQKVRDTHPLAFLSKPVNWNELRMAIESAMYFRDEKRSVESVLDEFRQKFEEAPLPYQTLDAGGNITAVNRAWTELMGYTADEVTGRWFGDIIPPAFHPKFEQNFEKFKKEGIIRDHEHNLLRKDGQRITISVTGRIHFDQHGKIHFMHCILTDITQKKRLQEKLEESEERFRILFEEAPLGYQSLAENGGIIYVNNAWCKMLGYSKKEATGKWFGDFLTPEEKDGFKKNFSVFKQKGEAYNIEYKMIKKDGGVVYILIDGRVRYDEEGNYIQSHCILKDITAQKLAEDALRESEKKFRNLIESAGDIIYILDQDLNFLYGNNKFLSRHGVTQEQLIGMEYGDFHSDEMESEFRKEVRAVYKSGNPILYEYQSETDGRYFLKSISPIMDFETKKFESITVISRDITERVQSEEKLVQSEERYKQLVELSPDAIMIHQDGKFVFVNRATLELFGAKAPDELIGQPIMERVHPDYRKIVDARVKNIIGNQPNVPLIEEKFIKLDGTVFDIEVSANQISYRNTVAVQVIARDITRRKKTEEELATANDRLAHNLESMTRLHFLGTLLEREDGMHVVLQEMLDVAIAIANADMGNIQLLDRQSGSLKIRAHRGFGQPFLDFWDSVLEGQGTCGTALERRENVIVEDVSQSPIFVGSPALDVQLAAGVRAVLSTPLIGRSGKLIGMCSMHFRTPHRPDEQTLHLLDLLARQVGDIIERAQTEETLRESEQKLKEAQSIGRIGNWEFDVDHGTIEWSDETYKLYERDPALGPPTPDEEASYYTSEQVAILREYSRRAIETGEQFEYDLQARLPSGRTAFFSASMRPIRDESGRIVRLFGTVQDITGRKKIEKELYESRQMLQTVLDTIPAGVYWKDRDSFYLGGNHTFLDATGLNSSEEVAGKSDYDLPWNKEQADSFREYDKRIMESGIPAFNIIEPGLQADGTHTWARTSKVPLRNAEGNIVGILGTYEDITESKEVEEALLKSKELFEKTFSSQRDAIFILDAKSPPTVIDCNPATTEIFGYNGQEIIGRTTAFLHVNETTLRNFQEHLYAAVAERGFLNISEFEMRRKDGTIFTTEHSVMPLKDEKGDRIGWVSVVRDITKRILTEETLRKSQFQLSNAMQIARLGYWEYDVQEDLFTFDDHFYSIFRTSAEKVGGYTMSSARYAELFVHPEDMQVVSTETRKAIETDDPNYSRQLEHRMIYTDGETGYIAVRFYIVKDEQGRTVKTYGANQDITERKQAVIALADSEAMLRSILRTVSVGIGFVKNRVFEWSNKTYQKISGFSENELKGKSTRMVYPDDEEFKRAERMYDLMRKHGVGSIEAKHKHKNGKIIDVLINVSPIIPGDINYGVAFTLLDITERKKAEKEIREKSEDLSLLVNINTLVNKGADMDSITVELSREIKRIFDCDGAAVMLMDKKGESLVIRDIPFIKAKITDIERLIGQKLTGLKIKVSTDFIHQLMLEREKVLLINSPDAIRRLVRDYAENPLLQSIPDIIKLLGINSVIIIPLVSNNQPVGIIEISSRKVFKQDILERIANLSENLANIIARKQAESELNASETRFRAFMENLPVMTYMKDKEGKFIYGNKATLKLADRTSETYTGSLIDEFLSGDLAMWMKQMDKKVLITNKTADLGEWKWVRDNREQWVKELKFPIPLPDGETIIGGWMMDVTTKKVAESALKESEARYKDLIEKAGLAIMTDDNEGKLTYFNYEFARLFGYSMAGIKKQTRETLIHSKDLKKMIGYHNKRMKGGLAPDRYEIRGIQKNGNEIWMEVTTTVLSKQAKIIGTRNYIWNITEQKKTRQELENSVTRFRELFSSMSSGVAIYEYLPDLDQFVFRDMNKAGFRITQITDKKKIVRRNILEVLPGAKSMGLIDVMRKVVKSGKPGKLSASYYKDDRIELYIDNYVYKLPSGEIVSVFDDITESIVAEQVVWRNYEEIKKLSQHLETIREEERKQIASELHDELGQILTAIKMDVSWIRNKMPPERRGIKKRAGSTIQIIDEAIGSVQRLSMELRPRMLDDLGLLETLKAFFAEYERWAKISINYDLPQKEPDLIPGQEISIFRIIQESLTNVARHAGATEVKLIIKERNDFLDMKIQDNGIGIPDEKVHSSESFGILNMRERIQGWGGDMEIKGITGKGTTITVSIPVGKVKS